MNNGTGNITDWKVGQVDGTENIVIDYFGKYCDEALKEIAEKVGAEAWIEGQTVNICRCEHGDLIELGYDNGLTGIDPDKADNVKFYTRLYPVGSSRNIDPEKIWAHQASSSPEGRNMSRSMPTNMAAWIITRMPHLLIYIQDVPVRSAVCAARSRLGRMENHSQYTTSGITPAIRPQRLRNWRSCQEGIVSGGQRTRRTRR